MQSKVRDGLFALGILGTLLVVPLSVAPQWYAQTELPKRLFWQLATFALAIMALTAVPRFRRLHRIETISLISFCSLTLWLLMAWPFSLSPSLGWLPIGFGFGAVLWFSLLLLVPFSVSVGRLALHSLTIAALLTALIGLVQDADTGGLVHAQRFPFQGWCGDRLWTPMKAAFEIFGLDRILQTDRPGSLFGHTNVAAEFVAAALAVLGVFCGALGIEKEPSWRKTRAGLGFICAMPLALFLIRSGSRGAILAVAAGLAFGGTILVLKSARTRPLFGSPWRHLGGCLLVLIVVLAGFTLVAQNIEVQARFGQRPVSLAQRLASSFDADNTTVRERLDLWANTAAMVKDRPLFGVGAGAFPVAYPDWAQAVREHESGRLGLARQPERPHNEFLRMAAEGGLFALLVFLGAIVLILAWGSVTYLRSKSKLEEGEGALRRAVLLASMAGMVTVLASACVGFPLTQPATTLAFFTFGALALRSASALSRQISEHKTPGNKSVAPPFFVLGGGWRILSLALLIVGGAVMFAGVRAQAAASKDLAALRFSIVGGTNSIESLRLQRLRRLRHADAAAARQPENYRTQLLRAGLLLSLGRHREADQAIDAALRTHPRLANAYVQRCDIALANRDENAAFDAASEALTLQARSARVQLAVARVKNRMGASAEAWSRLLAALEMQPRGPLRLRIYLELAVMATQRGDAADAALLLTRAEKLAPADQRVAETRAYITEHLSSGSPAALAAWEKVLTQAPLHPDALFRVGLQRLKTGETVEALRCFELAFEVNPTQTMLLYHRARALRVLGRLRDANRSITACLHRAGKLGGDMAIWNRAWQLGQVIQAELQALEE
ncbi:MAG: O-antigen ligase family protein [Planctomycetota bacterium]